MIVILWLYLVIVLVQIHTGVFTDEMIQFWGFVSNNAKVRWEGMGKGQNR